MCVDTLFSVLHKTQISSENEEKKKNDIFACEKWSFQPSILVVDRNIDRNEHFSIDEFRQLVRPNRFLFLINQNQFELANNWTETETKSNERIASRWDIYELLFQRSCEIE